ncbi:hypothetical protein AJ80_02940 [Polytolypa hystricis UAMH7299]|uniref:Non-structural maintenance of chromosomes element 1 homolog n=1 Tax=Polytolypa hystricis (strain UAMH7299) TaxID=1447883 RepID=A0A2B7YNZ5_POLH7|nr:hypothetical protein AJ80_02940 [Polytolypa hystricis UAMH7299]
MSYGGEETYNDSHRAFLQAFMARSTMTLDEAKPVLAAISSVHENREILPADITSSDLTTWISTINSAISPLDLEIRSLTHQTSQARVFALVNTTSDALTQLATTYTADEIAFVKRVLDAMFETNNTARSEAMVVSGMQAVQLAKVSGDNGNGRRRESRALAREDGTGSTGGAAQPLSMREAESVMERLVQEGWLEMSVGRNYMLSPRALMELRTWLVDTYNDEDDEAGNERIKFCLACKEIITVGQRCPRRQCPARLHDTCAPRFFRTQQSQACPTCRTEWTGENFVGERAFAGSSGNRGARRSGGGGGGGGDSSSQQQMDG